jgi:transposase
MAKTYRPYCPDQMFLLPPSPRDWLPENHLSYFVSDIVDNLNLEAIESYYEKSDRGQPPYHPRMMTKVLVYAYCVGIYSSRKIHARSCSNSSFIYSTPAKSAHTVMVFL